MPVHDGVFCYGYLYNDETYCSRCLPDAPGVREHAEPITAEPITEDLAVLYCGGITCATCLDTLFEEEEDEDDDHAEDDEDEDY